MAPPGEEFALRNSRAAFIAHLALLVPWSIFGSLQFVPTLRKSMSYRYHRFAGHVFLALTVAVAGTGLAMATQAFGGGFVGLVGLFVLSISILFAGLNGYIAIRMKRIPEHRDWMIRLFAYATSVLTLRLFLFLGMLIVTHLGGQSTTTRCDVIESLAKSDPASALPACQGASGDTVVAITASFVSKAGVMAGLRQGYEASTILALFVHASLAELWIRSRYYTRNLRANEKDKLHFVIIQESE